MSRPKLLLLPLALSIFLTGANAAPLCTTFSTLAQIIAAPGGACDYAGVTFDNWAYSANLDNGVTNVGNAANVHVNFVTVGGNKPTVQFTETNGEWDVNGTGASTSHSLDIRIGYNVNLITNPSDPHFLNGLAGIDSVGEGAIGTATWDYPTGTVARNQAGFKSHAGFADNIQPLPNGTQVNPILNLQLVNNPGPNGPHIGGTGSSGPQVVCDDGTGSCTSLIDSNIVLKSFGSTAKGFIDGPKDITISSGKGSLNGFNLQQFDEQFQEVFGPEPQTFILFGAGLLALAMVGRKYQKKASNTAK